MALSARLANHITVLRLSWQWRTIRANQRNRYRVKTALFGNCDNLKQLDNRGWTQRVLAVVLAIDETGLNKIIGALVSTAQGFCTLR